MKSNEIEEHQEKPQRLPNKWKRIGITALLTMLLTSSSFYIFWIWNNQVTNLPSIDKPPLPQPQKAKPLDEEIINGEETKYIISFCKKNGIKVLVETRGIIDDYTNMSYEEKLIKDPNIKAEGREINLNTRYKAKVEYYPNGNVKNVAFKLII